MSKPDLTAAPYELDDDAIAWVRSTIDAMDLDEKVGQLFINLNNRFDDEFVNRIVDRYHPGGMRYNHTDSASIQAHIRQAQARSKVPLLVASNIEAGGNGASNDGTLVATPLQTASTPDTGPPTRWVWSAAGSPERWAATGRSPRSWTSTTTGGTRWSRPGRSAMITRR